MAERVRAETRDASVPALVAAFAVVYVIWGSTYLAIRFAIETMPPFLMAGARFTLAGGLMYGWLRLRGAPRPAAGDWRAAAVVGFFMLLCGNGAVAWAEQVVPSGVASLVVATEPIWMVTLEGLRPGGERPGGLAVAGLALGTAGVALLVGPGNLLGGEPVDPVGTAVLFAGGLLWAAGSLRSRETGVSGAPFLLTAMIMLAGGAELLALGLAVGEAAALDPGAVSLKSAAALLYLVVFGAIVAYGAYIWLMQHASPGRVATHAYVNPVVALLLGAAFAGESLNARVGAAAALILASVVAVQLGRFTPSSAPAPPGPGVADDDAGVTGTDDVGPG